MIVYIIMQYACMFAKLEQHWPSPWSKNKTVSGFYCCQPQTCLTNVHTVWPKALVARNSNTLPTSLYYLFQKLCKGQHTMLVAELEQVRDSYLVRSKRYQPIWGMMTWQRKSRGNINWICFRSAPWSVLPSPSLLSLGVHTCSFDAALAPLQHRHSHGWCLFALKSKQLTKNK